MPRARQVRGQVRQENLLAFYNEIEISARFEMQITEIIVAGGQTRKL